MRTNILLDDQLVQEAFRYSKARTKKDLIDEALRTFVEVKKRKDLRDLKGKVRFKEGYDYKTLRKGA